MDSVRSIGGGAEPDRGYPLEDEPRPDAPPVIGTDERRMHVRAYNYWVSLLDGRPFPSITDIEPGDVEDFADNSVLLDFTGGPDTPPAIVFLGRKLCAESGAEETIRSTAEVPAGSLLSRLTDHYLEIIANRAPIGFEAEFVNRRSGTTMYRGILMPFSAKGEAITYVYGVINWKDSAEPALTEEIGRALRDALPAGNLVWADGPGAAARGGILAEATFTALIQPDQPGDTPVERRGGATWNGIGPGAAYILPEAAFGKNAANDRTTSAIATPPSRTATRARWRAARAEAVLPAPAGEGGWAARAGEDGLLLLVARREPDGSIALLAPVTDAATVDRALRHAGK
jgi:hypothetical protein